jgi:hypothetical protein
VDRTHSTADLEDGVPVDSPRGEGLDQRASQTYGPFLTVGAKTLGHVACVELAIERGVAG